MKIQVITEATRDDVWLQVPGQWRTLCTADNRLSASLSCPECGEIASLNNHTIDADGTVRPSLVCPYDKCHFHSYIKLEGWSG